VFINRIDAGQQLADTLKEFENQQDTIVLAIPRGGVVLGYIISIKLNLALELVMLKKLRHPDNKEIIVGLVGINARVISSHEKLDIDYIENTTQEIRTLLGKRYKSYSKKSKPVSLKSKRVILVDDGILSGDTLIEALKLVQLEDPK